MCKLQFIHPLTKTLAKKHADRLSDPTFTLLHAEKPDADNISKLLLDVLTECRFWIDDKQASDLILSKRYGANPRIVVTIYTAEERTE